MLAMLVPALAASLVALALWPSGQRPPDEPHPELSAIEPAEVDGTRTPRTAAAAPQPSGRAPRIISGPDRQPAVEPVTAPESSVIPSVPLPAARTAAPTGARGPAHAREPTAQPALHSSAPRRGSAPRQEIAGPSGYPDGPVRPQPRAAPRSSTSPAAAPPRRSTAEEAVAAARARYEAGDLEAARTALALVAADPEAAAVAARLDAIAHLLGAEGGWPPSGGAAALERLLELEAGLRLSRPSPLAARARVDLAAWLARKGVGLADEGRWEEAAAAFRAALDRDPGHPAALAGLERIEQGAEALYLEGYLIEDEDPERARRLYHRALRLARPDGPLAARLAVRLSRLRATPAPSGTP